MKSVEEFLAELRGQGVRIWADDGRLKYRAPRGAMMPALTQQLYGRRDEILALLSQSQFCSIPRIPDQSSYELSHAQRRVWVLAQMDASAAAYNIPLHQVFEGGLDRECLQEAYTLLIQRHESLRTNFIIEEGEPRQQIHATIDTTIEYHDLRQHPNPDETARALGREHAMKPFDLQREPLIRAALITVRPRRHVWLLTIHHIVCDGVSIGVLGRELGQLYRSLRRREEYPLPPLRIQYRDYAAWQSNLIRRQAIAVERDFWLTELSGKLPVLDLLTDYPRPGVQTYRGKELYFTLGLEQLSRLRLLGREQGASLFMTILTVLKVLLYRYTGQDDIVVGSPVASRHHADLEDQVGLYLNTLAFRDRLAGEQSFRALLQQVCDTVKRAFDHQIYPFDHLINDLNLDRDLSRSPLFDVMMILQNQEDDGFELDGVRVGPFFEHPGTSKTDLTFCFKEGKGGLFLGIEFNTDLFREERVRQLGGHFLTLVKSALDDPGRAIRDLRIQTDEEEKALLDDFSDTASSHPAGVTVVELFESQAAKTPNSTAVLADDAQLTYRELNDRSNQLARHLQSIGAGPEDLLAICMKRTANMVVGLLGVLKSGAAYVPLDPAFPAQRLAYTLKDANASILVTDSALLRLLPERPNQTVCLDSDWPAIAQHSTTAPTNVHRQENLAYVIHTSGSTGKPKGVQISHQALTNFLLSMAHEPGIADRDVLLAVTTLSFDIAALEMFLPLVVGARLVVASREVAVDGLRLQTAINECGATVMQATPATWRMLVTTGWQGRPDLKILCGGEALACELAQELLERGASLWNLYGPTETTIWSAVCRLTADQDHRHGTLEPVGRPINNTQIYVLDPRMQPVPSGVRGELYIGGEGLARGYLNRPDLTAEKFVPDPFSSVPGARLYRTGDVVCHRGQGVIEFLGRCDDQVKIRGYRIELSEIEAVLTSHHAIGQAAVIAQRDDTGDDYLVAYYVAAEGMEVADADLRSRLREELPDYMMPASFQRLTSFPQTPNGKVDRKALAELAQVAAPRSVNYVAPRDDWEVRLAEIWRSVVGGDRVGIYDNFFEVGGHSLKATSLAFKVQRDMGVRLSLIDVFRNPTLIELASLARWRVGPECEPIQPLELSTTSFPDNQKTGAVSIAPASAEELEMLNE